MKAPTSVVMILWIAWMCIALQTSMIYKLIDKNKKITLCLESMYKNDRLAQAIMKDHEDRLQEVEVVIVKQFTSESVAE